MFIDDLNYDQCWELWSAVNDAPVKTARLLYPHQPPQYVVVTKLLASYAANKGTALGIANEKLIAGTVQQIENNHPKKDRIKVYADIAAKIYCDIPAWAKSINFFDKEK